MKYKFLLENLIIIIRVEFKDSLYELIIIKNKFRADNNNALYWGSYQSLFPMNLKYMRKVAFRRNVPNTFRQAGLKYIFQYFSQISRQNDCIDIH